MLFACISTAHFSVILHCFDKHVMLERNNTQGVVGSLGTYHMEVSVTCLKLFNDQCKETYLSPKLWNLLERQEWKFSALSSLLHKLCTLVLHIQLSERSPLWSDSFPEWLVICWLQAVGHHKKHFIPSPFSTDRTTHKPFMTHHLPIWLQSLISPFAVALKLRPSRDKVDFISLMSGFKMRWRWHCADFKSGPQALCTLYLTFLGPQPTM